MKSIVFNQEKTDHKNQTMFFSEDGLNLQRYDDVKYPIFEKSTDKQLSFFWRPTEISLIKDCNDFQMQFNEEHRWFFTKNLQRQMLLDSQNGRGPSLAFLPFVTLPEIEAGIVTWSAFETIHSRSYQHIIRNLYANPSVVFNGVMDDELLKACSKDVAYHYDRFIDYGYNHLVNGNGDKKLLKKYLYLAFVNINALEALRFFVSFACTFAFTQNGLIEGVGSIMALIARDEKQHVAFTQNVLVRFPTDDPDFVDIIKECQAEAVEIYRKAAEQEMEWADYLFKDTTILGLNANILKSYIKLMTYRRMTALGLPPCFPKSEHPIPWIEQWLSSDGVQKAPQETEIISYRSGSVKLDITDQMFVDYVL